DPSNASTSNTKTDGRDVGWEWAISINAKTRRVKCKLCGHECSGWINRFKNHLLQIPGDVKAYPKTTPKIINKVSASMKKKNQEKIIKQRIDRHFEDEDEIDNELDDFDALNVMASKQILTKRKKFKVMSDVRGPLNLLIKSDPVKMKQKSI
ncbi:hypothetical protein MKW92_045018, partial [Papaver armeniacum]